MRILNLTLLEASPGCWAGGWWDHNVLTRIPLAAVKRTGRRKQGRSRKLVKKLFQEFRGRLWQLRPDRICRGSDQGSHLEPSEEGPHHICWWFRFKARDWSQVLYPWVSLRPWKSSFYRHFSSADLYPQASLMRKSWKFYSSEGVSSGEGLLCRVCIWLLGHQISLLQLFSSLSTKPIFVLFSRIE